MTLMPVTRIDASVDWSTKGGASAWIGAVCSAPMGPSSSIGSPMTFMIRPSVFGPTGTRISEPVERTSWPRVRPSVVSMAIVRTTSSPRCWATSSTRRLPPLSVSSAERIGGRSPSNATSTTAPMTWLTRPTRLLTGAAAFVAVGAAFGAALLRGLTSVAAVAMSVFLAFTGSLERLGARNDFDELGGDRGLAAAVVLDGQAVDHVARVARRIVHRGHLRAVEAGLVLKKGTVDLYRDVARQQVGEDFLLVRLIFDCCERCLALGFVLLRACRYRHDLLDGRFLHQSRAEVRVGEVHHVDAVCRV